MQWEYLEMPYLEIPVSRDASISRCCRISRWGISRYPYPEMVRLEIQYAEITVCRDNCMPRYSILRYSISGYSIPRYSYLETPASQDARRYYNMTTLRLLSSPAARRCQLLYRRAASIAAPNPRTPPTRVRRRRFKPRQRGQQPSAQAERTERADPRRRRWQT